MNLLPRSLLAPTGLALAMTLAAMASLAYLADRRAVAEAARDDAVACAQAATRVVSLREQGETLAAPGGEPRAAEMSRRVAAAAAGSGVPADALERVEPEPAPHASTNDAPTIRKATRVVLRGVTLRQFVTFLHAVAQGDGAAAEMLDVERVRLIARADPVAARPAGDDACWAAEATLTYLAPSPPRAGVGRTVDAIRP